MKEFARRFLALFLASLHWIAFGFIALFFAFIASSAFKFDAAGLEIAAFLAAIAVAAVVVILLFPLVFFRLPAKAKLASYALVLPALLALTGTSGPLDEAYKRTPQGAREAKAEADAAAFRKERDRKDAEQARQAKARQDEENAVRENLRYIAAAQEKVQGCISWRGQVPSLVRHVRESLHNPRSFEHVHSEMRLQGDNPVTGFPVIVMEYRAENGFGAIRTATVTAKIVPDDCSVHSVEFGED